ncbi:hypothetical protein PCANC_28788, partial [Puccinia coronata f. sp. avenae]
MHPSAHSPPAQTSTPSQRSSRMPYYTPITPRQFSSSAAKRESVLALGSIAHLQHYFVRNGLAARNRSVNHKNMILALPGRDPSQISEEEQEAIHNLPPEPTPPPPKSNQPHFPAGRALPNLSDLEAARQEVMAQLDQVCDAWGLIQLAATRAPSVASNRSADEEFNQSISSSSSSSALQNLQLAPSHFATHQHHQPNEGLIINLISITTRAVRSVQKFILTIPDPDIFSPANITHLGGDLQRRMSQLELSTAARPRTSRSTFIGPPSHHHSPAGAKPDSSLSKSHPHRAHSSFDPFALFKKRTVTGPMKSYVNSQTHAVKDDPLLVLRKMSLEVLACLKDIEHKFRIPGSATPMENQDILQIPDHPLPPNSTESSTTTTTKVSDHHHQQQQQQQQDEDNSAREDNSLVLPNVGWEYRQDVSLEEVRDEALVVKEWLECVDGILEGLKIITRTQRRKKDRLSVANHVPKMKKKKSAATTTTTTTATTTINTEGSVFKKLIKSSKFHPQHHQLKVPDISLDDATTEDESNSEETDGEEEGDGEEGEEDLEELLPEWARNDRFLVKTTRVDPKNGTQLLAQESDQLGRLFSCLVSHLPIELLPHLVAPHGDHGSRLKFLDSLSDGTLICLAYNSILRKSQRPWGFIPMESIHNLATTAGGESFEGSLKSPTTASTSMMSMMMARQSTSGSSSGEQPDGSDAGDRLMRSPMVSAGILARFPPSPAPTADSCSTATATLHSSSPPAAAGAAKVGLTFRRMENIKVWAAALKLRYMIKGDIPVPPSSRNNLTLDGAP